LNLRGKDPIILNPLSVLKNKIIRYLRTIARFAISALALAFVLNKTDLTAIQAILKKSNLLYLAAACFFFILSKMISSYRLNHFFRDVKINLSEKTNLQLYFLGMFYNLFLPGGIGGDGYKVYYLHKHLAAPLKKSILALVFDRVTGLIALGILSLIFLLAISQRGIPEIYIAIAIVALPIIFYLIVYQFFNDFYKSLHVTNILSLLVQIFQVISAWMILITLGNDQQTLSYLFVFLLSSVVAVIPFTIGGVGAREVVFLYASDILQLDLSTSIALSLLFFSITAIVSLFGLWYVIRPDKLIDQSH
jgi:uncharacterized membrane protein YbhN (UPF0104 family)